MRLAASNIAWAPEDDESAADLLTARGVDLLEVAPTRVWAALEHVSTADATAWQVGQQAIGLTPVSAQSLLYGRPDLSLFGDPTSFVDHLGAVLRLGSALGVGPMVLGSPKNRVRGDQPATDALPALDALAAHAEQSGVVLVLEPNPPAYGADFATTGAQAAALVREVARPGLRLHLDLACALLAGDDPAALVREHADVLAHVHVSAPQLAPVAASLALEAFAGALRDVGYAGVVTLEMRPAGLPSLAASVEVLVDACG